jgi:hypothetical protein
MRPPEDDASPRGVPISATDVAPYLSRDRLASADWWTRLIGGHCPGPAAGDCVDEGEPSCAWALSLT